MLHVDGALTSPCDDVAASMGVGALHDTVSTKQWVSMSYTWSMIVAAAGGVWVGWQFRAMGIRIPRLPMRLRPLGSRLIRARGRA